MSSFDMLRVTLSMSKDQGIGLGRRMAERVGSNFATIAFVSQPGVRSAPD